MTQEPVTVFISRRIKPGVMEAVEKWTEEIRGACSRFPGFLGAVTLDPHRDSGNAFHVVFRFASFEELRGWEESPERAAFYQRLQPFLEEEHAAKLTGFEPWFPPSGLSQPVSPPKWKIWVMAQMAVFPTVLFTHLALGSFLERMPLILGTFVDCIPVSFLMSFFAMPWLTRIFRAWLYPMRKS